jgi:hypothetical protein
MQSRRTILKVFGCVSVLLLIAWIVVGFVQKQQSASRREATKNDIKRIMLAMHNYHDVYDQFPPAFVVGPDGKRWHSWRALILPYLEPELAKQYRFDEPWNGPHNKTLLTHAPEVFQSDTVQPPSNATSYFAVVGKRTLWPADQSLRLEDIHDGSSNTIAVVEDPRTDVQWLEPKDLLPGEFFKSLYYGKPLYGEVARTVGIADGSTRWLSSKIDRVALAGLLTPSYMSDTFKGNNWPADLLDEVAEQSLHESIDVSSLKDTTITPASTPEFNPSQNCLWAATFQMVWDQLKREVDGSVKVNQPTLCVDHLNAASFDMDSLSSDSYLTAQTGVSAADDRKLLADLERKFPDVNPPLNPIALKPGQSGLRLYAMMRKRMPFESRFDRFQSPLAFSTGDAFANVSSFGHAPATASGQNHVFRGQVEILDDRGDDDFILKLNSVGSQQDEIILGLVPPETNLQDTWSYVEERIRRPNPKHSRPYMDANETLQIPVLDFSLQKHFVDLEGLEVSGFPDPATLTLAFIDIRLRLDETGADFMSAGEAGVVCEYDVYVPDRIRKFVFNRSFFISMKEPKGKQPWFLGWIANGELMETFAGKSNDSGRN